MQMRRRMFALALSAGLGLCASTTLADITGTVSFEGEAPEPEAVDMAAVKECAQQHPDGAFDPSIVIADGKIANVVVSIKPADGQALEGKAPAQPAKLDQKGCQYSPHVIAVMVGQPIVVANSDPFLHNVHSLAIDNPAFNFGQPNIDPGRKVDPMKTPERFKIKCDVHPWMSAFVSVFEHPFFAVTKEDGTFTIPGKLPDGKYTLVAWHEKFGEQEKEIEVSGGKAEGADFSFKAEGADAGKALEPVVPEVKVASFSAKAETTKSGAEAKKPCCEKCETATPKTVAKQGATQAKASVK